MDNLTTQEIEAMKQAVRIKEMVSTEGWKDLQNFLERKMNQSFPDPSQFITSPDPKEAFLYAAMTTSIFKKVIAEILGFVAQQEFTFDELTKKKNGEVKSFKIGSE